MLELSFLRLMTILVCKTDYNLVKLAKGPGICETEDCVLNGDIVTLSGGHTLKAHE